MPTSVKQLLTAANDAVPKVTPEEARRLIGEGALVVDVRDGTEVAKTGKIKGAVHVSRGMIEFRADAETPYHDPAFRKDRPVILYCASGARSAFAAETLRELGYEHASSLAGGYTDWKRNGYATTVSRSLSPQGRMRYSRHLLIPEVGEQGQLKLLDSRVLLVGAGGLGSPASLYLAAAGVGRLGIIDADVVDESNLQRQIVHST